MSIRRLDHYNIAAPLAMIEALRSFYCEVLGFEPGLRPPSSSFDYWLYAGGQALLHLRALDEDGVKASSTALDSGWFNHIAIACSNVADWRRRLDALAISYRVERIVSLGQLQLFLRDPAGVSIELNFIDPAAASTENPSDDAVAN